ncbi:DUF3574 domain-containing protein [Amycolatopsis sp. GA6-003]|uniref:DUF3574 domain-containing protein n=1 Tax=Amycolatopsis sp. GA6-003 TaxID=2652444 RepID=UPI0039173CDA
MRFSRRFVLTAAITQLEGTNQHANGDLEQIRTDYKHLFAQESVLRTDSTARVSF